MKKEKLVETKLHSFGIHPESVNKHNSLLFMLVYDLYVVHRQTFKNSVLKPL